MADVPENPASPDPLEAAEAQDPSPVTQAAEPEVPPEAVEPPAATEAEAFAPESWKASVAEESSPEPEPTATVPTASTAPDANEQAVVTESIPIDVTPLPAPPEPVSPPPEPETAAAPPPSEPTSTPPVATPSIAATLEAPPLAHGSGGTAGEEGGEWELLTGKVRAFLDGGELQAWWNRLGGPLRGFGLLIALVLVLRLYDALLGTLGDLPLVPRLLQLAGLIALVRFALTKLVRSEERQAVLNDWKARWQRFRG